MKISGLMWIVLAVLVLAGGWYWMGGSNADKDAVQPSVAGTQGGDNQVNVGQPVAPVITVATDATLGEYLVASNGMTLYLSTKDAKDVSNCSGACAVAWPPYMQTGAELLAAGDGVTGTLATTVRTDGGSQITYNGAPLYFYKSDVNVGDVTGQNVGGYWFVVKP